ncbi:Ig-like domain-containing protein [Paenibacillus sp. OV219]|uniref:Ig-like domain-containing protein n=1 Tax=Paenibacillus sp. OV219 TaxID=1884377 RepID=UPI0008BEB504|nr:Ig-like domain-containing protein [Paenibacillus sp. OV219]SEO48610.1 hypothetical protein SAMN05518847_10852 [Paenibacillus sp. OV219]
MSKRQRKQLHKNRSMKKIARMIGAVAATIPLALAIPVMASAESPGTMTNPGAQTGASTISSLMLTVYANELVAGNSFSVDLSLLYPDVTDMDFHAVVQNKPVADATVDWVSEKPYLRLSLKKTGTTSIDLEVTPKGSATFHEKFQITVASNSLLDPNNNGIDLGELVKYIKSNGLDSERFKSTSEFRNLLKSAVSSTVTEPNHAPQSSEGLYSKDVADTAIIDLNDLFSDEDGDSLTYQLGSLPSGLPFSAIVTGSDLLLAATGVDDNAYEFDVTATDSHDGTATKHFSITSTMTPTVPENHAPTGVNATISFAEDSSSEGQLDGSDIDLNTLTYMKIKGSDHGAFELSPSGYYTYTPYANYNGTDTITYMLSDGITESGPYTVTFNIGSVNDSPTVNNSSPEAVELSVSSLGPLSTVLDLDDYFSDVDDDSLTYTVMNPPGSGVFFSATASGTELTLKGKAATAAAYTLEVQASDGSLNATKYFSVTAIDIDPPNDAPVAMPAYFETNEDTTYSRVSGILVGVDTDNDYLTYQKESDPAHGQLEISVTGGVTYTPNANYYGMDSFTYTVSDGRGGVSAPVTVNINVISVNDDFVLQPIGNANNEIHLKKEQVATIDLSKLFTDVEGDAAYEVTSTGAFLGQTKYDQYLNITASTKPGDWRSFTITANDGEHTATDTIKIIVDDAVGSQDKFTTNAKATLGDTMDLSAYFADDYTIFMAKVINGVASQSVTDSTLTLTSAQNSVSTIKASASDGNSLTISDTFDVYFGSVINDIGTQYLTKYGNVSSASIPLYYIFPNATSFQVTDYNDAVLNSLGSFSLHEWNGYPLLDVSSFAPLSSPTTITIEGKTTAGDIASYTLTLDQTPVVNQLPVAENATIPVNKNDSTGGRLGGFDPDGNTITYNKEKNAEHGTFDLDAITGFFSYRPDPDFIGTDTITYTLNDGTADSALITITFDVQEVVVPPVNQPPFAEDATIPVSEDTPISGNLSGEDPEMAALTFNLVDDAVHGDFHLNADGSYTYAPDLDFFGTDTITYTLNDGAADSAIITVTFDVTNTDDEIRLNSIFDEATNESGISLHPGVTAIIDLTKLFTSVDGDPVEYQFDGQPNGEFEWVGNQLYIYGSSSGLEEFTVKATDDVGDESVEKYWAYATIKVNGTYNSSLSDVYFTNSDAESQNIDLDAYFGGAYTYTVERPSGNAHAELSGTHLLLDFEPNDNSTIVVTASNGTGLSIHRTFHTYIGMAVEDIGVQTWQNIDGIRYAQIDLQSIFPNADQFDVESYDDELYSIGGSFDFVEWSDEQQLEIYNSSSVSADETDSDQWIVVTGRNSSDETNVAMYIIKLKDNKPTILYDEEGTPINYENNTPLYIQNGGSKTLTIRDDDGIYDLEVDEEGEGNLDLLNGTHVNEDGNTGTITLGGSVSGYTSIYIRGHDNVGDEIWFSQDVVVYDAEVDFNEQLEATIDLAPYVSALGLDPEQFYVYSVNSELLESEPELDGTILSLKALPTAAGDYILNIPVSEYAESGEPSYIVLYVHIPQTSV